MRDRPDPAIEACFRAFQDDLRRLAHKLAREVIARELARHPMPLPRPTPAPRRRNAARVATGPQVDRHAVAAKATATTGAPRADADRVDHQDQPVAVAAPIADATATAANVDAAAGLGAGNLNPPTATAAPASPSRREWSRTRVVTELAQWLLEDPAIDAATLGRRGHGALASQARRLFGRFDAALNAANVHLAELYPDGPPSRSKRAVALG